MHEVIEAFNSFHEIFWSMSRLFRSLKLSPSLHRLLALPPFLRIYHIWYFGRMWTRVMSSQRRLRVLLRGGRGST